MQFLEVSGVSKTGALTDIHFTQEKGKKIVLAGETGSGKSTLMRVLAGLYPAERIALTLDDGPIHVSPAETAHFLRARATLIPQDAEVVGHRRLVDAKIPVLAALSVRLPVGERLDDAQADRVGDRAQDVDQGDLGEVGRRRLCGRHAAILTTVGQPSYCRLA